MRHAAGMLVAAVEQDDGAARRARHGRPMAIKQFDAIVGLEGLLFDWPHENSSGGDAAWSALRRACAFGFADARAHPVDHRQDEQDRE